MTANERDVIIAAIQLWVISDTTIPRSQTERDFFTAVLHLVATGPGVVDDYQELSAAKDDPERGAAIADRITTKCINYYERKKATK